MVDFMNVKYLHYTIIFPSNYMILKDKVLLSNNILSSSCKEAKYLKMLGVEYIPYDACLNDYILYRGEYVGKEICFRCGSDRYHN